MATESICGRYGVATGDSVPFDSSNSPSSPAT